MSRDDNRDALRYNRAVIKKEYIAYCFMGHAGYVNHSRMWHFKMFGSFNHIRTSICHEKKHFVLIGTLWPQRITLSNNYIVFKISSRAICRVTLLKLLQFSVILMLYGPLQKNVYNKKTLCLCTTLYSSLLSLLTHWLIDEYSSCYPITIGVLRVRYTDRCLA